MWSGIKKLFGKKSQSADPVKTDQERAMDWIANERSINPEYFKPVSPAGDRSRRIRAISSVQKSDDDNPFLTGVGLSEVYNSALSYTGGVDSPPSAIADTSTPTADFTDGGTSGGGGASGDW
jgi:uncharacterized membrane protein YgcG